MSQKKLLITGASGFIGSFLVEEGLKRGYEVHAGVRPSSSRVYLSDERIKFFDIDFSNREKLRKNISDFVEKNGKFDYVIHNAGITKAKSKADYFKINFEHTRDFADILKETNAINKKFVFISSLAASGPGKKNSKEPIRLTDVPNPVTSYGKSKLEAEKYLNSLHDFSNVIVRPTNVYGPREKDIYIFFKMISRNIEPYIGLHTQLVSFIYVKDLVKGIFLAAESPLIGKTYFAADGNAYDTKSLGTIIKKELGKNTLKFSVPVSFIRALTTVTDLFGGISALNNEKVNELEADNWLCDALPMMRDLNFTPEYDLKKGVKETVQWYKTEGWIN